MAAILPAWTALDAIIVKVERLGEINDPNLEITFPLQKDTGGRYLTVDEFEVCETEQTEYTGDLPPYFLYEFKVEAKAVAVFTSCYR